MFKNTKLIKYAKLASTNISYLKNKNINIHNISKYSYSINSLSTSLFNDNKSINSYKIQFSRGAKRKMERTLVQKTEHMINIAKNRTDPTVLTDEFYPQWLNKMDKRFLPEHYDFYAYAGVTLPDPEDCITMFRSLKKNKKVINRALAVENFDSERAGKHLKKDEKEDEDEMYSSFEFEEDELLDTDEDISDFELDNGEKEEEEELAKKNKATKQKRLII